MEILRTPVKNSFSHSTPRFPSQDSGYFGSDAKSCSKNLFALSPVNESPPNLNEWPFTRNCFTFTPQKSDFSPGIQYYKNAFETYSPDVIRQLRFEESGIGNESLKLRPAITLLNERFSAYSRLKKNEEKRECRQKPPNWLFQHISPNIKRNVDFITGLKKRNCEVILSNIFSNLSSEDLSKICCVSRTWRDSVLEDTKANTRRKEYLEALQPMKENIPRSSQDQKKGYVHFSLPTPVILGNLTNSVQTQEPKNSICSRFDSFLKEGLGDKLMKCPICYYAARRKNDCDYICTKCHYSFCKMCLSPSSKTHMCPMLTDVSLPTLVIGSKKCKRNLKRL